MSAARDTVTVRVPGSTSNCGAGFDTLGLALTVYNQITLRRVPGSGEAHGDKGTAANDGAEPGAGANSPAAGPAGTWAQPESANDRRALDLVNEAAAGFFRATAGSTAGPAPVAGSFSFTYHISGEVPPARGLGSSATIITGVLAGLDALHGTGLSRQRLAAIATALEGNPDNVSPSLLGGFTVSRCAPGSSDYVDTIRLAVPAELAFVVASPAVELITKESRGALPSTLPHRDAARSVNSAAYLTAAFATGDFDKLRHAVGDFLHEPYRLPKIPGARESIAAGVGAGALTGWLSGSGSSVLCVTRPAESAAVATAMRAAFEAIGVGCEVRVLAADNEGLQIESQDDRSTAPEGCTPIEVQRVIDLNDHDLAARCLEVVRLHLTTILPQSLHWRTRVIACCHHHPENVYPVIGIFGATDFDWNSVTRSIDAWIEARSIDWLIAESRKISAPTWAAIKAR